MDNKVRQYFWSGNTPSVNGNNTQSCGIWEDNEDSSAVKVMQDIIDDKKGCLNSTSFVLVAFNEVPYHE